MNTTSKQDQAFNKMVSDELPNSLLQSTIDWIRDNLQPDGVFEQSQLNKFVSDVAQPDEVFSEELLRMWAIEKEFTPPEKKDSILSYANLLDDTKRIF